MRCRRTTSLSPLSSVATQTTTGGLAGSVDDVSAKCEIDPEGKV